MCSKIQGEKRGKIMPKWSVEEIECPSCGKKSEFKVWGSIDGAVNAKMKQEVLSEEMFTFKCPD